MEESSANSYIYHITHVTSLLSFKSTAK